MSVAASIGVDPSSHRVRPYPYLRRRLGNMLLLGAADAFSVSLALAISGAVRWQWLGASMLPRWSVLLIPVWWIGAWGARLLPSWGLGAVEELHRLILLLGA